MKKYVLKLELEDTISGVEYHLLAVLVFTIFIQLYRLFSVGKIITYTNLPWGIWLSVCWVTTRI